MQKSIDFNAFAQVVDTTWGRSSTPKTASYSVKVTVISADRISVQFQCFVNFKGNAEMIRLRRKYEEESISFIDAAVKSIKKGYKELTGDSIKIEKIGEPSDSLEVIGSGLNNLKKTALFKRKMSFQLA